MKTKEQCIKDIYQIAASLERFASVDKKKLRQVIENKYKSSSLPRLTDIIAAFGEILAEETQRRSDYHHQQTQFTVTEFKEREQNLEQLNHLLDKL